MSTKEGKKINKYDSYGKFIKTYVSAKEASDDIGCNISSVYYACSGKKLYIFEFQLRYYDGNVIDISPLPDDKLKKINERYIKRYCCVCGSDKYIQQYKTSGKYYCSKHYRHMNQYGEIIKTLRDGNEIITYDTYSEIILTDKYLKERGRVKISNDKLEIAKSYRWYLTSAGYACSKSNGGKAILLHRLLTKVNDDEIVDHKNRDRLDCRNENLRICTQNENLKNSSLSKRNTSGVTGVWYNKLNKKWVAEIFENGNKHRLGTYINKEDAINVRKEAEQLYFGEFAPMRGDSHEY